MHFLHVLDYEPRARREKKKKSHVVAKGLYFTGIWKSKKSFLYRLWSSFQVARQSLTRV